MPLSVARQAQQTYQQPAAPVYQQPAYQQPAPAQSAPEAPAAPAVDEGPTDDLPF